MAGHREARKNPNSLGGDFGFGGSTFTSVFAGNDPFHDPFFTSPFSMFGSNTFSSGGPANFQHAKPKGPVIQELDSDDDDEVQMLNKEGDVNDAADWRNKNPLVEHPEDQANEDHGKSSSNGREILRSTNNEKVVANKEQSRSSSYQRVTYGGINGAYYTATTSRRTGNDGVTVEERRQADKTTGQATHRISRGLQDKGHSVTRTLGSDGKVDTVQTLHNLNEDELEGFEQAWRSNGDRLSHGWNDTFDFPGSGSRRESRLGFWGGFMNPFKEHSIRNNEMGVDRDLQAQSSRGRPKKIVTINID
ncbi:hypothetical protein STAS_07228 [Striga asiatica]|uniref:Glycine-rich protein n=1 Tax=Striga asiatica TaxID=4170 RepID=A0A5A7PFA8_STRAF|nr:hypothetical protein STAS_07228 [Striga asiatica]